ncbi:MAG: triose-phosphate isomerase [Acidobacteriaceae bacterium]
MSSKKMITANWKMYKTTSAAKAFFGAFLPLIQGRTHPEDQVVVCPGFPLLSVCAEAIRGSGVMLGAQDLFWEAEGAWTGEVSGEMLTSVGCTHVLIGHSERRQHFHETNHSVNKKLKAALQAGLHAIVCIGESLKERECDSTDWVLKRQYLEGFEGIEPGQMPRISIAYEPCWAIGTGRTATPQIAADAHAIIRAEMERSFGEEIAHNVEILYGGSVRPDNARALMSEEEIDGALVGGASLDPQSFAAIVNW